VGNNRKNQVFSSFSKVVVSAIVVCGFVGSGVACGGGGGGGPAAKDPTSGGSSTSSGGDDSTESSNAPPKKTSKYPEPFLEPDCSSVGTDGYLANAKAVVAKVHQDGWDKLKRCVADVEDVHGEVLVSFRLDPDGVPRCVEAPGSSMNNDDVINCVIAVYRTFHYPSPQNGSVHVTDGIEFDVSETDDDN
jgi:hypothetical protein